MQLLRVLAFFLCGMQLVCANQIDGSFEATVTKQVALRYRTVTPKDYDPQKQYPLIIFLHGRGEQGDNLDKVQIHGPFKKVAEMQLPVVIVAPQSPQDEWWDIDALSALVDHLLVTLPVDKSRVYLTGLSMGGHGTWLLANRRPEVFAAIAPICGYSIPSKAKNLKDMPIWIFHGTHDDIVRVQESSKMADALYEQNIDARLTIYPEVGHDSWTQTYNNPELYKWMLAQRKK